MPAIFDWISSAPWLSTFVAGASAAALTALQFLRQQPRQQSAATLLFWLSAAVPQRARTLFSRRFSRLGSFALLLAIVGLLALAIMGDTANDSDGVFVIDAGRDLAETGSDGRPLLAAAIDDAVAVARAAGRRPAVFTNGATPVLREPAGTPPVLSAATLSRVSADVSASDAAVALTLAAQTSAGPIDWFTRNAAVPRGLSAEVESRVRLHRLHAPPATRVVRAVVNDPGDGRCAVEIGVATSDVTLRSCVVAVAGPTGVESKYAVALSDGHGAMTLPDLPADGSTLGVRVDGHGGAGLKLSLPRRPALSFWFAGDVPRPLREGLLSLGAAARSAEDASVIVGGKAAGKIRIQVVPSPGKTATASAVLLADAARRDTTLEGARAIAPETWPGDGEPLLRAGANVVAGFSADWKTLLLADSVVASDAELPRRAAFVVLLRQWCDRLTGRTPAPPVVTAVRAALDPTWPAGVRSPSVVDDLAEPDFSSTDALPAPRSFGVSWPTALLVAALGLAVIDGLLWAARRVV